MLREEWAVPSWPLMESYHPKIRVDRDGDVVTVTLDNPASKNACTGDMWVSLGETFRTASYVGARVVQTEDGREGMTAFIERRPPVFKGR
jgi:enoyl-CoA hydratase/carnithine racemase